MPEEPENNGQVVRDGLEQFIQCGDQAEMVAGPNQVGEVPICGRAVFAVQGQGLQGLLPRASGGRLDLEAATLRRDQLFGFTPRQTGDEQGQSTTPDDVALFQAVHSWLQTDPVKVGAMVAAQITQPPTFFGGYHLGMVRADQGVVKDDVLVSVMADAQDTIRFPVQSPQGNTETRQGNPRATHGAPLCASGL